jgi:hypothetical protein
LSHPLGQFTQAVTKRSQDFVNIRLLCGLKGLDTGHENNGSTIHDHAIRSVMVVLKWKVVGVLGVNLSKYDKGIVASAA